MFSDLTRREFLKLSGLAALNIGIGYLQKDAFLSSEENTFGGDMTSGGAGDPFYRRLPPLRLGRTTQSLHYYSQPSFSSTELGFYNTDTVVRIFEEKLGDPEPVHNPFWYRTSEGWIHSSFVQPVHLELNQPVLKVPSPGMLVEVTVPYTQAWKVVDEDWKRAYRFYYKSVFWANYVFASTKGNIWYQILDDRHDEIYLVRAQHMRPIAASELTPISPHIQNKHIEVDLTRQKVMAFESGRLVYAARIATGYFEGDTPIGEYRVERKQPTRHMASVAEGNEFDLPGVPWVCYIAWTGVSLHGTYWHNNYGTPQSHGCINMTPEASKWIYRWSAPYVPADEDYVETDHGTRVVVYE